MNRPARPKSAKGKLRPTPPSRPHQDSSNPTTSNQRHAPQPSTSWRGRNTRNSGSITKSKESTTYASKNEEANPKPETESTVDPSQLPDIMRPVSSLSRYGILPGISSSTGGGGDVRSISPAQSELEMELMSSFAQQMILDSAKSNKDARDQPKTKPESTLYAQNRLEITQTRPMQRNSNQERQRKITNPTPPAHSSHQDGPVRKKSRTAHTVSVFNKKATSNSKIMPAPDETQERLKLALKLPDGRRVERYFSPKDTINGVMHFAQSKMRTPAKHCDIYSMVRVPKVLIADWKQTLAQLDLRDRTVLYIDKKDEFSR